MSNYQGNCINSFDENGNCIVNIPFENVSDFAYACENQILLTKENFEKLVKEDISLFTQSKNLEYSYYEGVFILYDVDSDIHYFFKEKDYLLNNNYPNEEDYKNFTQGCCSIYAHAMLERNLADKVIGVYKTDDSFVHAYAEKDGILYDILGSRKIEDVYLDIFLQFSSKMNIDVANLIVKDIKGGLNDYYLYDEALQLIDNNHSYSFKKHP